MQPQDDPTIMRIRATRHRISQQFDHDPQKLVAHYIALQEQYQRYRDAQIQIAAKASVAKAAEPASTIREGPSDYVVEDADLLILLQGED